MSPISQLPTRAEFIRDRLAEHLDGLGYFGLDTQPETLDESPTLYFEWPTGDRCVFVDELGAIRDMDEPERADGRTLTMRGFEWWPEPTDTGVMHGPALPTVSTLNDWFYRYGTVVSYCGPYVNRSGFRVDPWAAQFGARRRPAFVPDVGQRVAGTTRTV